MIDRLLNTPTTNMLERVMSFTEQRHEVILENIANVSTPGYVQKDVSAREFQQALAEASANVRPGYNDPVRPRSGDTVEFGAANAVRLKPRTVVASTPFHDRGIRSMESLMTQLADNAQAHNMAAQFLRNRYDVLSRAISMKA